MKKLVFLSLLTLFSVVYDSYVQTGFTCNNSWINPPTLNSSCYLDDLTSAQIASLPLTKMRVNVHFIGTPAGNFYPGDPINDWSSTNGNKQAVLMINEANRILSDIQPGKQALLIF